MSQKSYHKEQQYWATEKPKLDNARELRGSCSVDPEDMAHKETVQMCEISWNLFFWILQCRANCERPQGHHPQRRLGTHRRNVAMSIGKEKSFLQKQEDHIAEKGYNPLSHYKVVHKRIPMPQAMKIPDAEAAVDKNVGQIGNFASMARIKSQKVNKKWWMTHRKKVKQFILQRSWTFAISKILNWTKSSQNTEGRVVLRGQDAQDKQVMQYLFTFK